MPQPQPDDTPPAGRATPADSAPPAPPAPQRAADDTRGDTTAATGTAGVTSTSVAPTDTAPTSVAPTNTELTGAEATNAEPETVTGEPATDEPERPAGAAEVPVEQPADADPASPTVVATGPADSTDNADGTDDTDGTHDTDGAADASSDAATGRATPPPTAVVAPRWTGSAPVPPPRPRKRRWFRSDAGPEPARPDPTLAMPSLGPDESEMPTPVDPWAGVADDPWTTPPPPHAAGVPPLPATGSGASDARPPAERLPATRRFPAPPPPPPVAPPPVAPSPPVAPPPAAPVSPRPPRQRRRRTEPPPAPPPGWQAPPGYVPVPVRRRRRWPRVMFLFILLTVVCCCGVPAYYVKPYWDHYPAHPVDPLPTEVRDFRLLDNREGTRTAERLKADAQARPWLGDDVFAAVYQDRRGKRITVFGSTGFRLNPESDVTEEIDRLREQYRITGERVIDTGERGHHRVCGTGRDDGDTVVVCAWADHGSLGTALFTRLSIEDSSDLLTELRDRIVRRG